MSTKTPGEVAKEAYQAEFRKSLSWEASASAVIEMCAEAADDQVSLLVGYWVSQGWGKQSIDFQRAVEGAKMVADRIRSLKRLPVDGCQAEPVAGE